SGPWPAGRRRARRCRGSESCPGCSFPCRTSDAGVAPEGWWTCSLLSLRRNETRDVDDLQLDPVRVVEENRVVPSGVRVLLRLALELDPLGAGPIRDLVDLGPGVRLERNVVQPDRISIVRLVALRFAEPDRRAGPGQVPDRLAALAFDLSDPCVADRSEQIGVERQAARDRGDDEVDVVDTGGPHGQPSRFGIPRL